MLKTLGSLHVSPDSIEAFCQRWKITELAVFGSVLRDDFSPESDVDVLVQFHPDHHHTLFDIVRMGDELEALFGRPVDVLDREAVLASENYIFRREVLASAQVIYAA